MFVSMLLAVALGGSVLAPDHTPVASVKVTLSGNNLQLEKTTGGDGRFQFTNLSVGTYELFTETKEGASRLRVDLGSSDATVTMTLLKTVALVQTSVPPALRGSGSDTTINRATLDRAPAGRSFPSMLLQMPGAARGANGVVHINGDHGDINYIVDGVPIPQELNRNIGAEFDPADVSFIEVLEGAYPAQYGNRFAAVVNVNTRTGGGTPGFDGAFSGGSYGSVNSSIGYHGKLGTGTFVANVLAEGGNRFLDPPNFASPHNAGSNTNEFFRFTQPHGNDYWNVSLSHSYQAFQIPNDVDGGQPATTDDNEAQSDSFLALQFHHALQGGGSLSYGAGYKNSTIRDLPDQANDFAYGMNANLANGGAFTDCAGGTISACGFSLYSNRTARDFTFNIDNEIVSTKHDVRFGAAHDIASVLKLYQITLQPNSYLGVPATTVTDNAPNMGHTSSAYLQDSWKMGTDYQLDYGTRLDIFHISSNEFSRGYSMISPRLKLTRFIGKRASVYAFYGRYFTPYSLENVSPAVSAILNAPLQNGVIAPFDLLPERDSVYEIGGHFPLGRGELGVRMMQKNVSDLVDDTQVGTTALHQDINYKQSSVSTQALSYQLPLARGSRLYASIAHTRAINKICETQLLAPCFGANAASDWTPADHDQTFSGNAGMLLNSARGGWFAFSGEYGSGLSTAVGCDPSIVFCKTAPHLTFDAEEGVAIRPGTSLTFTVRNLLNDRYLITFANAQGNHYASPRTFEVGLQFGRP
jgi:hypothetical protein